MTFTMRAVRSGACQCAQCRADSSRVFMSDAVGAPNPVTDPRGYVAWAERKNQEVIQMHERRQLHSASAAPQPEQVERRDLSQPWQGGYTRALAAERLPDDEVVRGDFGVPQPYRTALAREARRSGAEGGGGAR